MKDIFYVTLFYIFAFFIRVIPAKVMVYLTKALARLIYGLDSKHRTIAKVNLDLAYGDEMTEEEKERIIRASYENLLLLLVDFIRNQGISKEKLLEKVMFENESVLTNALENGQKVILVTAHYGNWELLPLSLAAKFGPLTGVGRKLDSSSMDAILKRNREQFDIEMLDKKGAMKEMVKVLKSGRLLGLLVDQNTSADQGILIDFFGKPARHTPSAAILARRFDALIIPVFITTKEHKIYTVTFYDPIVTEKTEDRESDIRNSVQKQATITEKVIRQKPEEWFWLHQRWKNQFEEYYK